MAGSPESRGVRLLPALALAAAAILVLPGCASPRAMKTYEYVATYERMSDCYEPLLSLVYVPRRIRLKDYRGIVIGDFRVGRHWIDAPEEAQGYAQFFRVALRRELIKRNRFQFVSMDTDDPQISDGGGKKDVLLVEGMITGLNEGSGLMRYLSFFLWFLQSGATDFQVEGRITEASSGRLVAEFVDRRRHLCNTPFGPNPHTFDSKYAMNLTAHTTAECLADFIDKGCDGLPAADAYTPADDSSKGQI
jgi:hypothetical protein